jgi:hypothetical protein
MEEQTRQWEGLLPGSEDGPAREASYGIDPRWASIYPYQLHAGADGEVDLEVRVRNYGRGPMAAGVDLKLPRAWEEAPGPQQVEVAADSTATARFRVRVPRDFWWPASRVAIAADVTVDGRRHQRGQRLHERPSPDGRCGRERDFRRVLHPLREPAKIVSASYSGRGSRV